MKNTFNSLELLLSSKVSISNFRDMLLLALQNKYKLRKDLNALDGLIIGYIDSYLGVLYTLYTNKKTEFLSDNQIQKIEQCIVWIKNNEILYQDLIEYSKNKNK